MPLKILIESYLRNVCAHLQLGRLEDGKLRWQSDYCIYLLIQWISVQLSAETGLLSNPKKFSSQPGLYV
jgi:hypothetical protein